MWSHLAAGANGVVHLASPLKATEVAADAADVVAARAAGCGDRPGGCRRRRASVGVSFARWRDPVGTPLVPADLPQTTERHVRERVVASVGALLCAARDREAIGSALER
jgi:hypothetical protein